MPPFSRMHGDATSPKTDGADAWRVLKVLEASQRSLSINGEPVQLRQNPALEAVDA